MAVRRPWLTVPSLSTVPRDGKFGMVELRGSNGIQRRADLYPVLVGMTAKLSRGGETTLTLTVSDPSRTLLTSGRLDAILDPNGSGRMASADLRAAGVWWRVTAIGRSDTLVTIECEDRSIADMREYDRPLVIARRKVSRAGFIRRLITEVRDHPITYFIPELGVSQPIARGETAADRSVSKISKASAGSRGAGGFGSKADDVRIKGRKATARQLKVLDEALTEAQRLDGSRRFLIATNMCLTQESVCGESVGKTGNDDVGAFQQGRNWISEANVRDVAKATRAFAIGSEANVGGTGAVKGWKQRHGSLHATAGSLDAMITAVQISVGGYSAWERESTRNVDIWLARNDGGAPRSTASTTTTSSRREEYQYRRGEAGGAREDSWLCGQRLADEVQWSLFAVCNTVWYASDRELAAARPVADFERTDDAVLDITWDQDTRAPVDDAQVKVTWDADPWALVPGMPVVLSGEGSADGRYLIDDTSIDFLAHASDLTLVRPGRQKREPAATVVTTTSTSSVLVSADGKLPSGRASTGAQAVYDFGLKVSGKYPYAWAGGHASAGSPSRGTNRRDGGPVVLGYDCSGGVAAALVAAGWGYKRGDSVPDSGTMARTWGRPGRGKYVTLWADPNHVFLEFHGLGRYRRLDTQNGRDHRALGGLYMETTAASTAGYTPRHWPGF
jgi:hypothetical protein